MRRLIVAFALLALGGCNHSSRRTDSAPRSSPDAPATPSAIAEAEPFTVHDDEELVRDAFGGALPSLPALAADGRSAALLRVESIALGEAVRWDVWFVPAGKGKPSVMPILTEDEGAQVIAEMPIDTRRVGERARAV